jgi:G:T-mismatch repair DNA endonuclease (very short patch repair protein)
MEQICLICDQSFSFIRKKQTCSQKCLNKLRKQDAITQHQNLSYSKKLSKDDKIKQANTKKISEEDLIKVKEILSWEHINDKRLLLKRANVNFSYRVLNRLFTENKDLFLLYKNTYAKFIPKVVQNLHKSEFNNLIEDLKIFSYEKVQKDWNIGKKSLSVISKKYIGKRAVKGGKIDKTKTKSYIKEQRSIIRKEIGSKTETWIEKIIRSILLSLDIDFSSEIYIVPKKHRCDFIINNTKKIIEVNGDFWHGHNKELEDMDEFLKKSINRYEEKVKYYKENDYELLEIWEWEINENLNNVINKIKKYVKKV